MPPSTPALIITDGSLGGLVATWGDSLRRSNPEREAPGSTSVAWRPPPSPYTPWLSTAAAERSARTQATLAAIPFIGGDPTPPAPAAAPPGLALSRMLLAALAAAHEHRLTRIIWPIHAGELPGSEPDGDDASANAPNPQDPSALNLTAIAETCDRALLIGHLAAVDGLPIRVEVPYVDLTDLQLTDLAIDMDAPLWACWWCEQDGPAPCRACARCRRHLAALERLAPAPLPRFDPQNTAARSADPAIHVPARLTSQPSGGPTTHPPGASQRSARQ
ncbi:MAG: hypothetical protein KF745_10345 [Phycisphaeraceae bacterium]|nr:hypothetical protein [Phycisphaeraceae bacterium]